MNKTREEIIIPLQLFSLTDTKTSSTHITTPAQQQISIFLFLNSQTLPNQ